MFLVARRSVGGRTSEGEGRGTERALLPLLTQLAKLLFVPKPKGPPRAAAAASVGCYARRKLMSINSHTSLIISRAPLLQEA